MARTILERELTVAVSNGIRFDVANETDDAGIRRLLRENPMPGRISISLEREPDFFADHHLAHETRLTIVARNRETVVCVGSCAVRRRFVNGEPRPVGYLGGLRLDKSCAGRFDVLRRGYDLFHKLQAEAPADFYFTSIASDNEPARRFLERGLPGMPRYEFIGEFITLLLPTMGAAKSDSSSAKIHYESELLAGLVNESNRHYQFAPCWTSDALDELGPLGLNAEDLLVRENGNAKACAALWDQRSFKQTVIRGYAPLLKKTRSFMNPVFKWLGRPALPPVGSVLAHATVSHLAVPADELGLLVQCIAALRNRAAQRHIALLSLGFAASDPRLAAVRARFKHREYRSRIYVVRWPDIGAAANELDGRPMQPELALL